MRRQQTDIRLDALPEMAHKAEMTNIEGELVAGGLFSLLETLLETDQFNKILLCMPGLTSLVQNYQEQRGGEATTRETTVGPTNTTIVYDNNNGMRKASKRKKKSMRRDRQAVTNLITELTTTRERGMDIDMEKITNFLPMFITFVKRRANVDVSIIMVLLLPGDTSTIIPSKPTPEEVDAAIPYNFNSSFARLNMHQQPNIGGPPPRHTSASRTTAKSA